MPTSPRSSGFAAEPAESSQQQVETAIARLAARKQTWLKVEISARIAYLQQCLQGALAVAEQWAAVACRAKGIATDSILAGEEWLAGPTVTLFCLRSLIKTLEAQGQPQPAKLWQRSNGQYVAQVFPDTLLDQSLWLGVRGEVWLEPGALATQGLSYHRKPERGRVALVLGAGNISAIAPTDVLYKLFAEDQVVLLKMNPVNAYLGPLLEQAFQSLQADGFVEIVYGGADLGCYLCQHPEIDTVHITGSHQTHDAIVWGSTLEEQRSRKLTHTPLLSKPITSELGCITPVLVVPGHWSHGDINFQARQVASMVAHNASFNCTSAQVLITAKGWPQREQFLQQLHQQLATIPARLAYYPGAEQRYQAFLQHYPQAQILGSPAEGAIPWTIIPDVAPNAQEYALQVEAFCGILAEVTLEASDTETFLNQVVPFVNTALWGNLSCVVLIDSKTQKQVASVLDMAIAQLHYGNIGVNVWTGLNFSLPALTWGAFPGNSLQDIQSGRGVVHNTYLFEHPQKSVVWAPFRIRPTPIWFADHPNLLNLARHLTTLQVNPSWSQFLKVVWAALPAL